MDQVPRPLLIIPAVLFLLVLAVFIWGAHAILEQDRRLKDWVEVEATVVGSELQTHSSREGGRTHVPVVEYTFLRGGDSHTSRGVFPLVSNTDPDRAREIVAQHTVGMVTSAWVDPEDPSRSYLLREPSVFPHVFTLMALLVLILIPWTGLSFLAALFSDRGDLMLTVWGGMTAVWCAGAYPILRHASRLEGISNPDFLRGLIAVAIGIGVVGSLMTLVHLFRKMRSAPSAP